METLFVAAGWAGSSLFITAYFLVTRKRIPPDGLISQGMNLLGAILVGSSLFHGGNWGAFAGNVAWGLIAASVISKTIPRPARSGRFWSRRRAAVTPPMLKD